MTASPTPAAAPVDRFAAWRWGLFVTAFLIAQLGLAYAAVKAANSDGGALAIPGAEEEIARSYEQVNSD